MKKILKKLVIMSILVALLGQNVSVLAVNTAYEVSQARKIANTEQMANSGNSSEGQSSSGETESDGTSSNGENGGEQNATQGKTRSGEPEESSKSGNKLNIEIDLRLPIESPIFTVKLDGESVKSENTSKNEKGDILYYNFEQLETGKHVLEIEGEGYVPYTRNIEITGGTTQLKLTNGHNIENVQTGTGQIGIIGIGDVNQDGVIDSKDENDMMTQIEKQQYNKKYDLNNDKKIDIIDLSYITFNKKENVEGTLLHLLNVENANVEAKGTSVEGNLKDVLTNNESYVALAPTTGKISDTNPVEITLDLGDNEEFTEGITIAPSGRTENNITNGEVIIEDRDGNTIPLTIKKQENINQNQSRKISSINVTSRASVNSRIAVAALDPNTATITTESDGTIVINLGKNKVAVKKVTIKVTETNSNLLADISKVEFLNNMEERIPAPKMDIPTNLKGIPGSEEFTVTWDKADNVTGYEVSITLNGETEFKNVDTNSITVQSFKNEKIKNGQEFKVKVQSTNGNWKSGYSVAITVIPEANQKPDAPDNVSATGAYKSINVTWKDMKNTDTYNVYYRKYQTGNYEKVAEGLKTNSYKIDGLENNTKYQVYVTGVNKLGESNASIVSVATTSNVSPAIMPKYKLINTSNGEGQKTNHIKNVILNSFHDSKMVDSPLDTGKTAFGIVDDSFASYYQVSDWDVGGANPGEKAPTVEFDDFYTMSYFAFAQVQNEDSFTRANIMYYDEQGQRQTAKVSEVVMRKDENDRDYTVIKLAEPITTNKINIGIGRPYGNPRNITIAEMRFYEHDTLEQDIYDLYADPMHVTLKSDVDDEKINELQERLDTKDEVSGEYHPEKENLQKEIDTARQILNDEKIKEAIKIDTTVTEAKDGHITFRSGLNAWQPLGVVGHEGETIVIYVGNPDMKVGQETDLRLIATQYHAESSAWFKEVPISNSQKLKIGRNEITIPHISSLDVERGGSLYINYVGNNPSAVYGVRVSGGQEIPVLDLTKVETETDKKAEVQKYIESLEELVPQIETKHGELHKGSNKSAIDYDYQENNCILGATEIVLDQIMYSVSSKQILQPLTGDITEKTNQLYNSLVAMENMIDLFYSHKGLSKIGTAGAKNQYPVSRLNIRYQRMFAGAFMYAGGKHIGIEWNEIKGLSTGVPIVADNGKYESGQYFGWGIAHEIGHIINESAYAIAEITNNYFSVLAQAKDDNESVRFSYDEVYKKVTSGTIGRASNVFTQLGLYWQLHLAYDKGYNYKTYNTYEEQFDNLFFARVDTYARDVSQAPKPKGIALNITGADVDNALMRLAVAAAEKNILPFFERWGMQPNDATREYASQFEEEERAIYYINDDARTYQLENKAQMVNNTKVVSSLSKENNSNKIKITLGNDHQEENKDAMLGYEIIRSYEENGKTVSRAVAFVTPDKTEYIDTIETVNNRVFTYKVIGYDKYLNQTEEYVLNPVKVSHDGSISKQDWVVETNLISDEDKTIDATEQDPCEPEKEKAISKIANNADDDEYIGKVGSKKEEKPGSITISLKEQTRLVALKYKAGDDKKAIKQYEIQVSNDKTNWETVKTGTFSITEDNLTQTVYFNKENSDKLYTYDVSYVRLVIKGTQTEVSIAEIDLLGQTGDNVELLEAGIGKLQENYVYGTEDQYIPAGSVVFTGTYKGNPAYNVVKLWDENNKIVDGNQIIIADDPKDGELGEVSEGIWIYWIEPENGELPEIPESIRAELYRVDNAETNEGERLVSDTYRIDVPDELSNIKITQ